MDSDSRHGGPSDTPINSPPSSFGIELDGTINSRPFIKVKHNAHAEEIVEYVMRAWSLPIPSLIISVTGGAQDFNLKKEDYTTVRRGLGKLMCAKGTWFISEGTNCGVMKLCGEAAQRQKYNSSGKEFGPLIGIASWRKIPELKNLQLGENDDFHIESRVGLDPNHTHFIFVEKEEEDRLGNTSFLFRRKLETILNQDLMSSVVVIVVQGGFNTLVAVEHALDAKVPCAVIKGTLGTADLLASMRSIKEKDLENLEATFGRNFERETEEIMRSIWYNQSRMKMIPLHDSDNEYVGNIDTAILLILTQDPVYKYDMLMQLERAFRWNRVDVLEKILQDIRWNGNDGREYYDGESLKIFRNKLFGKYEREEIRDKLQKIYSKSLRYDCIDFVRILSDFVKLNDVHERCHLDDVFVETGEHRQTSPSLRRMRGRANITVPLKLFVDSIAYGRLEISEIFWKQLETGRIAAALFGGIIAKERRKEETNNAKKRELEAIHSFYEASAVELLTICHKTNASTTEELLKKPNLEFDSDSCLKLAERAEMKKFIAQSACQGLIERKWRDGESNPILCLKGPKFTRYNTPRIALVLDSIFSVIFVGLFSWMCLENLSSDISWQEGTVWAFVITQTLEELRQLWNGGLKSYYKNWWNYVDNLAILLTIVAFVSRIFNSDSRQVALVFYVTSLQIYFIRLTSFFSVIDFIGPKLLMIIKMLGDLGKFSLFALVFIFGYGVAIKALVFPGTGHRWMSFFWSIFFRPYFEMLGEHDVEDIGGNDFTNCTEPPWPYETCPVDNTRITAVAIGFKALFMFFTHVLLLNLLIAIFNNRYQEVERESETLWKYKFYFVVEEYGERPLLPPPFIAAEHLYRLCCWVKKMKNKCSSDVGPDFNNPKMRDANGKDHTSNIESKELLDWEEYCFEEMLVSRNKQKPDKEEERLTRLVTKITSQMNLKLGRYSKGKKQEPADEYRVGRFSKTF